MKKLISIILLLNILRFKYIEYRIPVKEENKIITKEITNEEKYLLTLEIPKIKLKRKIYNLESKNNNVNKNIELLKPFIEPSNKNGIIILAGHNGNSNVSYFNKLYKLNINDNIIRFSLDKKVIHITFQCSPSDNGLSFLTAVQKVLQPTDMSLKVELPE